MHYAYDLSRLLMANDQIEAIAAYDCNLLLGTRQGHLQMYSVTKTNGNLKYDILRFNKNFSKRPIQQLDVIPEYNLLICLTDGILTTYDINAINFPVVSTLTQTKGASLFALDNKSTVSLTGVNTPVIRLCVAVKRKLQIYYWKNGEFIQHISDIAMSEVPKVMCWGQEVICVGFKGEYTFFDLAGKPKDIFPTSSSRSLEPTMTKFSDTSFILGREKISQLVEEGSRDKVLHSVEESSPAKEIIQDTTVKWSDSPLAVVWDDPYILGLLNDEIVVQTIKPPLFIQTLGGLNKARLMYRCRPGFIYIASVSQVWCINAVDIAKQTQLLLQDKNFKLALKLTKISEETPDKSQKISDIRRSYALDLFQSGKYSEAVRKLLKWGIVLTEVIEMFNPMLQTNVADKSNVSLDKPQGKDLEKALSALIEYLTAVRPKINNEHTELTTLLKKSHEDLALQSKFKVVTNLLETIDTSLLKCYLQTNDAFIAPLLRLNHCKLDEAEQILLAHDKHSELIILYQTKGQHARALSLLRKQASQPQSALYGIDMTKKHLQSLGAEHINLIFEFSGWVLKENPEEGLRIFTEDMLEVEKLPRIKVLDFLLREHKALVIPYLEHVVHYWNDTNVLFHNNLICMYRDKITSQKGDTSKEQVQHTKKKLLKFLQETDCYTPETELLRFPNDCLFEERAVILGKLGQHEQALAIYVQILGDVQSAIKYCDTMNDKSKGQMPKLYVILMRLLVDPTHGALPPPLAAVPRSPATAAPDLDTALHILEKHADTIEPLKALSVLPDSIPLSRIKHFLTAALENQLSIRRGMQVSKGLLHAENKQMQEVRRHYESKSVVINEDTVCPVCKKRFAKQSAFVRYPNGDIVHYSCQSRKT